MRTLRVAVHVHSEWSYDARWPLADLERAFARRGYDAVLMTEHERGFDECRWREYQRACAEASTERVVFVPGLEYEDDQSVVHVPVWGDALPFLGTARPTLELLRDVRAGGGFAVFAHPARRDAAARYRPEWAELLGAIEIWNRQYDGVAPSPVGTALTARGGLRAFVGLDFHTARQFFPLALSIDIDGAPSPRTIIAALSEHRFRPCFMGLPATRFNGGIAGTAAAQAEALRRALRGPVRRVQGLTLGG